YFVEVDAPTGPAVTCVRVDGVFGDDIDDPMLAISPDNKLVAVLSRDEYAQRVYLVDWVSRTLSHTLAVPAPFVDEYGEPRDPEEPTSMAFSPDGQWLIIAAGDRLMVFDKTGAGANVEASCATISPDGRLIAVAFEERLDAELRSVAALGTLQSVHPLEFEETTRLA